MVIVQLSPQSIFPRPDARAIDKSVVRFLADSIAEVGLINPLRVRARRGSGNGVSEETYEVSAGHHRLQAVLQLGLAEVECLVEDDDDLRAELVMIDENLCRAEVSPADRARQTARRKAIYVELHPETVLGSNQHTRVRKLCEPSAERFTAETAVAIGKSERTVQLDVERGEKISERALALVGGTALNTGKFLDALKRVDGEDAQIAYINKALSGLARQQEQERAEATASRARAKIDADVRQRAVREVAEILSEHIPSELWDGLKANLYAAKSASDIADAFTGTGQSVMDRRFA